MFIGRKAELTSLERLYASERFEFAVIYGRRRVGKTALINEFVKNKENIFFTGVESNAKQNLENLSRCIMEFGTGTAADTMFASFQAALEYVFRLSEERRLVFVMDEYPYAARASKSLASTLQLLIDQYKDRSRLVLILCGSSMSYMEDKVLAYKAPLYGRKTAQFKIHPFDFFETRQYFQQYSPEDQAAAYGIVGGTPHYLMQFNRNTSLEENVKNTYLNPNSAIFEEPGNLLKQEVREPAIYNAIITAIATGSGKMSEIAGKVGEDSGVCSVYIKNLISLGIIKKETPYGEKSVRKTIYTIEDPMFRFWYRFIPRYSSIIFRGIGDLAYERIAPQIPDYMGETFEEICRQYLWKLMVKGKCTVEFDDLGRWWGTNPKTREQEEIDLMGSDGENVLLGECKWTSEKVGLAVLEKLVNRTELFHYRNYSFYLFSKSGFTAGCIDKAAEMGNVTLVSYREMLEEL